MKEFVFSPWPLSLSPLSRLALSHLLALNAEKLREIYVVHILELLNFDRAGWA